MQPEDDFLPPPAKPAPDRLAEPDLAEHGSPEALAKLYAAVAAAAGEFPEIPRSKHVRIKTRQGYTYEFAYAPMGEILRRVRPAMAKHGLAVIQPLAMAGSEAVVRTILSHQSGGRLVSTVRFRPGDEIKALGGQITYLRRYALNSILCIEGLEDADDDAMEHPTTAEPKGGGRKKAPPRKPPAEPPAEPPTDEQRAELNDLMHASGLTGRQIAGMTRQMFGCAPKEISGAQATILAKELRAMAPEPPEEEPKTEEGVL